MGTRKRLHREAVIAGLEAPFRPVELPPAVYLRCGKCGVSVPESRVTEHLKQCQPQGARCGKCGMVIPAEQFLEHFKACGVKPVEVVPEKPFEEKAG
ncbi:MAG: hypothetical protein WC455_15890 [Dehalococcoidia bacterium]